MVPPGTMSIQPASMSIAPRRHVDCSPEACRSKVRNDNLDRLLAATMSIEPSSCRKFETIIKSLCDFIILLLWGVTNQNKPNV